MKQAYCRTCGIELFPSEQRTNTGQCVDCPDSYEPSRYPRDETAPGPLQVQGPEGEGP